MKVYQTNINEQTDVNTLDIISGSVHVRTDEGRELVLCEGDWLAHETPSHELHPHFVHDVAYFPMTELNDVLCNWDARGLITAVMNSGNMFELTDNWFTYDAYTHAFVSLKELPTD